MDSRADFDAHSLSPILHLVPNSGVQFFDFELALAPLAASRSLFLEDWSEQQVLLLAIPASPFDNADIPASVANRLHDRNQVISCTALEGLAAYLNTWIPLPYLRTGGTETAGDNGPANWARIYIKDPGVSLSSAREVKAVLAVDTSISTQPESTSYLGPTQSDVLLMSSFGLAKSAGDNANFAAQRWVADWLKAAHRPDSKSLGTNASKTEQWHFAHYLAMLEGLAHAHAIPDARFLDCISPYWNKPVIRSDLVLELTASQTTALLHLKGAPTEPDAAPAVLPVQVRDLSDPTTVYSGPIPTAVEFDETNFGNASCSRRSGRVDAFQWPSIVRIGHEAKRLSLRASAMPGTSGQSGLTNGLMDVEASSRSWRFSREQESTKNASPIVSNEILSRLSEDGSALSRDGAEALRPRFSQSSLLTFFFCEVLLQALSQINKASLATRQADAGVNSIARIILAAPSDMPAHERGILAERLQTAIGLIWDAERPGKLSGVHMAQRPEIRFGIDSNIAAQFVYLYDEIVARFGGNALTYFAAARLEAGRGAADPALRIASLRFDDEGSRLAVIDYKFSSGGTIVPQLIQHEGQEFSAHQLLETILKVHVFPELEKALAKAGCEDAFEFLSEAVAGSGSFANKNDFGVRLAHRLLEPAARGLMDIANRAPADVVRGLIELDFADAVLLGGGRFGPLAAEFERMAAQAGAKQFSLPRVKLQFARRALSRTLRMVVRPLATRAAHLVSEQKCDLAVLSGTLPQHSELEDELILRLQLSPHRIVNILKRKSGMFGPADGAQLGQRSAAVALAGRKVLVASGFNLVTTTVEPAVRLLSHDAGGGRS